MKKKNLLMTAVVVFGLATITIAQPVPSYVPTTGLVGWWPFNGNANDESVNGNNGVVNGPILTTDRFGNSNKAYSFDGLSAFITAPKNYMFNNSITFNVWANITTLSGVQTLFSSWGSNSNLRTFTIYYESQYYRNSIQTINNQEYAFSNQPPVANVWTMLTGTYDGNTLTIYENGQLISSTLTSGSNFNLNQYNFYNFGTEDQLIQFYNGKLDDIGIWNRALTQQEITDLYNSCQLSVNTQPTNQTININNNAQFVVSSSDPNATYQWQTDLGVGFQNLNNVGQYSGTANDTITIANTTLSNNNQPFRCIISSGACTDTSNVAVLTVLCNISETTQPINQSVNISNNAQFTTASSDPLAAYQWQTDLGVGFQNLNSVGQYSGTANDTLTIANTTLSNNSQPFRCIISSGACTDTSNVAVLTVLCNISETTQPINQSVNISNNAQFTTASSDPLAAYQWQTDLGVGFQNLNSVGQYSGTANDTLTIANTTLSNNSQPFRCIISSGSCSDTSAVAVLTVNNNVGINEASQDNLFSVYPNPAQSVINVKADIKLIGKVYSVYDNTGKVVLTGKLNSENTTIELSNLSIGIYMFRVGENMKQTFKVIKE